MTMEQNINSFIITMQIVFEKARESGLSLDKIVDYTYDALDEFLEEEGAYEQDAE